MHVGITISIQNATIELLEKIISKIANIQESNPGAVVRVEENIG